MGRPRTGSQRATAAIAGRRHGIPVTAGALETHSFSTAIPRRCGLSRLRAHLPPGSVAAVGASAHRTARIAARAGPEWRLADATSVRRRVGVAGLSAARLLLRAQHTARARRAIRVQGAEHHAWDPWHGPGAVNATASNMANRLVTGRRPWSESVVAHCVASHDCASPRARSPIKAVMRTGLGHISVVFARLEAAIGRGAVVDIVAQRDNRRPGCAFVPPQVCFAPGTDIVRHLTSTARRRSLWCCTDARPRAGALRPDRVIFSLPRSH